MQRTVPNPLNRSLHGATTYSKSSTKCALWSRGHLCNKKQLTLGAAQQLLSAFLARIQYKESAGRPGGRLAKVGVQDIWLVKRPLPLDDEG